jgi:hypothetical protein
VQEYNSPEVVLSHIEPTPPAGFVSTAGSVVFWGKTTVSPASPRTKLVPEAGLILFDFNSDIVINPFYFILL